MMAEFKNLRRNKNEVIETLQTNHTLVNNKQFNDNKSKVSVCEDYIAFNLNKKLKDELVKNEKKVEDYIYNRLLIIINDLSNNKLSIDIDDIKDIFNLYVVNEKRILATF